MSLKKQFYTFICILFATMSSFSQNNQWKKIDESAVKNIEKIQRGNFPSKFELFEVDYIELKEQLKLAPEDISGIPSTVLVKFPDAEGNVTYFEVYTSLMMEPGLAAAYPEIQNYTAINKKDPSNTIKISITPAYGMHIIGFDNKGNTYYVDTYTADFNSYIFYNRKDIQNTNSSFHCLVDENNAIDNDEIISTAENQILSTDSKFRRYRLAMACTTEYAAYHVNHAPSNVPKNTEAQKKAIVLSAMNVTVNRVNSIYERDLAVRLMLVDNNTNIIFITTDNFSNNNSYQLIQESQTVITNAIGSSNFDIGHTVSTGGGGLASPSPCVNSIKARGITGSYSPVGDPFDIDYVAHEMGHQFGANHTFNNSCDGNRNNSTAMEPGSGSTIMGYAGICQPNVQQNSDAYFHQISIREISDFLQSSTNSCPVILSTANSSPTILGTSGNKTIPRSTPFILTTTASDATSTNLTYTWEQMNNEISTQSPVATSSFGPNFRSVAPTSSPSRSFPSTQTVLNGTTNSNGIVSSTWEVLPSVSRTMKFATTVRDNETLNGGQTKSSDIVITFANAGPFVITYPNNITTTTEPNWSVGEQKTITWNVAGTTANGINTANVNILMSQDNGQTYPFVLAANTPNDGSQTITVPALTDATLPARVKIEAVGNIFYTVSKPIYITVTAANDNFEFENFNLYPNPTSDVITISFTSSTSNDITFEIYDIRGRRLNQITETNTGSINKEINLSNFDSGVYLIKIKDGVNQSTKKVIKK